MASFPQELYVTILGKAKVGDVYTVDGTAGYAAERFGMNFQTGPGKTDDILFHFNPRFDSSTNNDNSNDKEWEDQPHFNGRESFLPVLGITKQAFETWFDQKEFSKFAKNLSIILCFVVEDASVQDISIDSVPQKMPPQSDDDSIIDNTKSCSNSHHFRRTWSKENVHHLRNTRYGRWKSPVTFASQVKRTRIRRPLPLQHLP